MVYLFADWLGLKYHGTPMYPYPYLDWTNFWVTFGVFTLQAVLLYIFNYCIAVYTQKKHGFIECQRKSAEVTRYSIVQDHEANIKNTPLTSNQME